MRAVLPHTVERFDRAIVMPNLKPAVTTVKAAIAYRGRIVAAIPQGMRFEPLMTLYLTDDTSPSEIVQARKSGVVHAVKLYPAGATTNSAEGVTNIAKCYATLAAMEKIGMPLLVHGEATDPEVDVFDREKAFIDRVLIPVTRQFPELRIVFEHITTQEAVEFTLDAPRNVAATITVHHLLLNRNALFQGGVRPHHYCLPVLKREIHRKKLVEAATSGNPKFFLGTDSAPHPQSAKETDCGCAGIYTAHAAIELYAEVFEQAGELEKLEAFASFNGADFYGLPRNTGSIALKKENWTVPEKFPFGDGVLIPFRAKQDVRWKIADILRE
jgi:dihydroorotase